MLGLALAFGAGLGVGGATLWLHSRRLTVTPGQALIVTGSDSQPKVYFESTRVWPLLHRWDMLDISLKILELSFTGSEGLLCRDNIRVDVKATIMVCIPRDPDSIVTVAKTLGCERASDLAILEKLFFGRASQALKVAFKGCDFDDLSERWPDIREQAIVLMGQDLHGYQLEDLVLESWQQTPLSKLDPNNILDAEGIRKITERVLTEKVVRLELERDHQILEVEQWQQQKLKELGGS